MTGPDLDAIDHRMHLAAQHPDAVESEHEAHYLMWALADTDPPARPGPRLDRILDNYLRIRDTPTTRHTADHRAKRGATA